MGRDRPRACGPVPGVVLKVLVVGSGGREHALVWKLAQSADIEQLYAAPGNPGIAALARCVPIAVDAIQELAAFAASEAIDVTVVGPELPLTLGLVDRLTERGLRAFGPTAAAAELEGSKVFAKNLLARHGIPTAGFGVFDEPVKASEFVRELGGRAVVKADGLAAGKGAVVCHDVASADRVIVDMLERRIFGAAGARVVVEELLEGEELSFFALTDGEAVCPLGVAQDHKAAYDGDRGPNTGGMGAYAPPPLIDDALSARILATIIRPTVRAMAAEGRPYRGVLFAGLMVTSDGPKVLEYNARFGDPECQTLMVRLGEDLLPLCRAVSEATGLPETVAWRQEAAVCVVLASGGYPAAYTTGHLITGLEDAGRRSSVTVFHAGTAMRGGQLVTAGGRVLGVTALGPDFPSAIRSAYAAADEIRFEGKHCRRDIGRKALGWLSEAR